MSGRRQAINEYWETRDRIDEAKKIRNLGRVYLLTMIMGDVCADLKLHGLHPLDLENRGRDWRGEEQAGPEALARLLPALPGEK